jgi:hypothetical protein
MKPNEKQLTIIKAIESCCEIWRKSNDISSPSHYSLISDEVNDLIYSKTITEHEEDVVEAMLEELYNFINSK